MTILHKQAIEQGWQEEFPSSIGWYWAHDYRNRDTLDPVVAVRIDYSVGTTLSVRLFNPKGWADREDYKNCVCKAAFVPLSPRLDHHGIFKPETLKDEQEFCRKMGTLFSDSRNFDTIETHDGDDALCGDDIERIGKILLRVAEHGVITSPTDKSETITDNREELDKIWKTLDHHNETLKTLRL